jgi:aryl-alcohol dehydrogenase-like predicted oxidoreductase
MIHIYHPNQFCRSCERGNPKNIVYTIHFHRFPPYWNDIYGGDLMIRHRVLGKSGLKVSEVGLGCWAIGGPSWDDHGKQVGWSGSNDQDSLAGLYKAYELGINHWDTADVYGKGHSERLIGKVFNESVKRDEIILATKAGWFKGTAAHPYDPLLLRHQFEQSLKNLRTDYVDIYYLHTPFFGDDNIYLRPAADVVHKLKEEGKVRFIGQSAYSKDQFLAVCPVTKPDILQLPYNALHSPFDSPDTDIFSWADEHDLGIVMFGTYAMGLLLGKYDQANPPKFDQGDIRTERDNFSPDYIQKLGPALDRLKEKFDPDMQTLAWLANQYALHKSKNAVAIPGFKNPEQVEGNYKSMLRALSIEEIEFVTEIFSEFKDDGEK